MKKIWVLRFLFVFSIIGLLLFFWYSFRQYQLSASDPLTQVDDRVEWMLVIHDWTQVDEWIKRDSLSEITTMIKSDIDQWKTWYAEYPEIQNWLKEQPTYVFYGDKISQHGIWSWGLPDKWTDEQLAKIQAYIPHLEVKEGVLYWSMDQQALAQWTPGATVEGSDWQVGSAQMDESQPVSWMARQSMGWICVDFDRYQWVGLMSADNSKGWKTGWAMDSSTTKWKGSKSSYAWTQDVPEWRLDSTTRAKFKVFSMDTLCDCDTWESWTNWQLPLWTYMQYDSGWVAMQKTAVRPWKLLAPLLKDTTQKIKRFIAPHLLPPLHCQAGPGGWRLAEEWSKGILLATDSNALKAYHADTASLSTLVFPVAGSRRVYHEMWAEGNRESQYSPVQVRHWLMGKTKGELNIFLSDDPQKWIVQLRAIK